MIAHLLSSQSLRVSLRSYPRALSSAGAAEPLFEEGGRLRPRSGRLQYLSHPGDLSPLAAAHFLLFCDARVEQRQWTTAKMNLVLKRSLDGGKSVGKKMQVLFSDDGPETKIGKMCRRVVDQNHWRGPCRFL